MILIMKWLLFSFASKVRIKSCFIKRKRGKLFVQLIAIHQHRIKWYLIWNIIVIFVICFPKGKRVSNSFLPGIKKWLCVLCSLVDSFLFFLRDVLPGVTGTLFIFLPFGVFFLLTTHAISQSHIKAASAEDAKNSRMLVATPDTTKEHSLSFDVVTQQAKDTSLIWAMHTFAWAVKKYLRKGNTHTRHSFSFSMFKKSFWNVKNACFLEQKQYAFSVQN